MKPPGPRWRALAGLTAAVLALHGLALQAVPGQMQFGRPGAVAVLRMRALEPAAHGPIAAAAPRAAQDVGAPPPAPSGGAPIKPAPAAGTRRAAAPQRPPAPEEISATAAPAPAMPVAAVLQPAEQAAPVAAVAVAVDLPVAAATAAAAPSSRPERGPAGSTPAFALPGSVRLHYRVQAQFRGLPVPGQAQLTWRHDGSSYEAQLETSAPLLPLRTQRSTGQISVEGLAPTRFSDKARSEEAAHFERDRGKIVFSSNRPEAVILPGAQDRLSVLLQLGALIAGAPLKFPPGTTIVIQTAGTRDADLWHFTVGGEEELALPGGTRHGLKLTRDPRKEFDQRVELWLGAAMDYVPVRLRLTQPNGDWLDLQWSATDRG